MPVTFTDQPSLFFGPSVRSHSPFLNHQFDLVAPPQDGETRDVLIWQSDLLELESYVAEQGGIGARETGTVVDLELVATGSFSFSAQDGWQGIVTAAQIREDGVVIANFTPGDQPLFAADLDEVEPRNLVNTARINALLSRSETVVLNDLDNRLSAHDLDVSNTGPLVIHGLRGDDELAGSAANDRLHGGRGDDTLGGTPGRDKLYGGPGDDLLYLAYGDRGLGGRGEDHIELIGYGSRAFGGNGDDLLEVSGFDGINWLTGGAGADRFALHGPAYVPGVSGTIVRDFDPSEGDRIVLDYPTHQPVEVTYIGDAEFSGRRDGVIELRMEDGFLSAAGVHGRNLKLRGHDTLPDDTSSWLTLGDAFTLVDTPPPVVPERPQLDREDVLQLTFFSNSIPLDNWTEEQGFAGGQNPLTRLTGDELDQAGESLVLQATDVFAGELGTRDALSLRLDGSGFAITDGTLAGQLETVSILRRGEDVVRMSNLQDEALLDTLVAADGTDVWLDLLVGDGFAYLNAPNNTHDTKFDPRTSESVSFASDAEELGYREILGTRHEDRLGQLQGDVVLAKLGRGDDTANLQVDGQGLLSGQRGNDLLSISSASRGDTRLLGGSGDDYLEFRGHGNNPDGSAVLKGGRGDDVLSFEAAFEDRVTAWGGAGADQFTLITGVAEAGTGGVTIMDFEPGIDGLRIDYVGRVLRAGVEGEFIGDRRFFERDDDLFSLRLEDNGMLSFDTNGDGVVEPYGMVQLHGLTAEDGNPLDWLV